MDSGVKSTWRVTPTGSPTDDCPLDGKSPLPNVPFEGGVEPYEHLFIVRNNILKWKRVSTYNASSTMHSSLVDSGIISGTPVEMIQMWKKAESDLKKNWMDREQYLKYRLRFSGHENAGDVAIEKTRHHFVDRE